MKPGRITKYVSALSTVIMLIATLLVVMPFFQLIIPPLVLKPLDMSVYYPQDKPFAPIPTEDQLRQKQIADADKEILPDGTIHLVDRVYFQSGLHSKSKLCVWDVNYNLLWSGDSYDDPPYIYLNWLIRSTFDTDLKYLTKHMISPLFSDVLIIPVVPTKWKVTEYWRYKPHKRYFVGSDSNGIIGYAGANGVKKSEVQVEPFEEAKSISVAFPIESQTPVFFWLTQSRIYKINFENRDVSVFFDAGNQHIERVRAFRALRWMPIGKSRSVEFEDSPGIKYRPAIHIRTEQGQHHLLLRDPDERITLKTPEMWRSNVIDITATKDNIFLKRYLPVENEDCAFPERRIRDWEYKPGKHVMELYSIDTDGNLELINHFEWIQPAEPEQTPLSEFRSSHHEMRYYLRTLSPLFYNLLWRSFFKDKPLSIFYDFSFDRAFITWCINVDCIDYEQVQEHLTNWPVNLAMSLLMTLIAFWYGYPRRTSSLQLALWLLLAFIFNLVGLITYLALNHSAVIKCPVCGKKRGLNRPDCPRCGADLPAPEKGEFDLISDV